ncbi:MAG: dockerin type I repeat-containing protein [Clostridia bacterium]|nr:dockerin type I repeat-containing protein [Clostridia bacterium]
MKFKKILAVILAAVFMMSLVPASVFAVPDDGGEGVTPGYYVVGSDSLFEWGWSYGDERGLLEQYGDGKYRLFFDVPGKLNGVNMKVVMVNEAGDETWYGDPQGKNIIFDTTGEGEICITFDPDTDGISISGEVYAKPVFNYRSVYVAGNGQGNFLHGIYWSQNYSSNKMTQTSQDVWEITYENVAPAKDLELKFTIDGSWDYNFGGSSFENGKWLPAAFDGSNICFDVDYTSDIVVRLDLSGFDFGTKSGAEFEIEVRPHIKEVRITDVHKTEYVDGYMDNELGYFIYDVMPDMITVIMADDEEVELEFDKLDSLLPGAQWYARSIQDYGEEPLSRGENDVSASVEYGDDGEGGVKIYYCDYKVVIDPPTIDDKEIGSILADRITIKQYTRGNYQTGMFDPETGFTPTDPWFYYDVIPDTLTFYDDMQFEIGTYTREELRNKFGVEPEVTLTQSYVNQLGTGVYRVGLKYLGNECHYEVEIVEAEACVIVADDVTVEKDTNGEWIPYGYYVDGEYYEDMYFHYYERPEYLTVRFSDGREERMTYDDAVDAVGHEPYIETYQSSNNQWVAGNTYTVVMYVSGNRIEYNFTVSEYPPNDIASISIADFKVTEYTDGYYTRAGHYDDEDNYIPSPEPWFNYDFTPPEVTLYDDEGEVIGTYSSDELYDMYCYTVENSLEQTFETRLGLGKYDVEFEFLGMKCDCEVEIVEADVHVISAEALNLVEHGRGRTVTYDEDIDDEYFDEYFEYFTEPSYVTVEYKDGSRDKVAYEDLEEIIGHEPFVFTDQASNNPWTVGNSYNSVMYASGNRIEYPVSIVESPVSNVVFEKKVVEQFSDCEFHTTTYYEDDEWKKTEWFRYRCIPDTVKVYYKDSYTVGDQPYPLGVYDYGSFVHAMDEFGIPVDYDTDFGTDQDYDNQWGIGTYHIPITVGDTEYDFEYEIVPCTVKSVSIEPDHFTTKANQGGYYITEYDPETGDEIGDYYYYTPGVEEFTVAVEYEDGRTFNFYGLRDLYDYGFAARIVTDQSFENQWGEGEHTATLELRGITSVDFIYEITDNPIVSVTVYPLFITEGTHISRVSWYNDKGHGFYYQTDVTPDHITVEYRDGTKFSGSPYEVYEETGTYISTWLVRGEDIDYILPVGDYEAQFDFEGFTGTYDVFVEESEIESVTAEGVSFMENTNGYMQTEWTGPDTSVEYYYYDPVPERVTVKMKDGTEFSGYYYSVMGKLGFELAIMTDQSIDNQWKGGNTYSATLMAGGATCTFPVEITELGLVGISAEDRVYMEGTFCSYGEWHDGPTPDVLGHTYVYRTDFGYGENFDDVMNRYLLTLIFKDHTETLGSYEIQERYHTVISTTSDQSVDNEWGVGDHTVTVELLGFTCEYTITITESTVESVTVSDIGIPEYSCGARDGYYDDVEEGVYHPDTWFHYWYEPEFVTLKHKDGTTEYLSAKELSNKYGAYVWWEDTQSPGTPFVFGENKIPFKCMKHDGEFSVWIVEPEIESIEVEDITIFEGTSGYRATGNDGQYYWFYYFCPRYTLTTINGNKIEADREYIEYGDRDYVVEIRSEQGNDDRWGVGDHTATLWVAGIEKEFTVHIIENPIDYIEFDPIVLQEEVDGRFVEEDGERYFKYDYYPEFTVHFKDGSSARSDYGSLDIDGVHLSIESWDEQERYHWSVNGINNYVYLGVTGFDQEPYEVEIVPAYYKSVEIFNMDNGHLGITIVTEDGEETYEMLRFRIEDIDDGSMAGVVETDKGDFSGAFSYRETENGVRVFNEDVTLYLGALGSNTLDEAPSLLMTILEGELPRMLTLLKEQYDDFGGMTREKYDRDAIVTLAVNMLADYNYADAYTEGSSFVVVRPETAREAVYYLFGIDDIEIDRCHGFNAKDEEHPRCGNLRVEILEGECPRFEYCDLIADEKGITLFFKLEDSDIESCVFLDEDGKIEEISYAKAQSIESIEIYETYDNDSEAHLFVKVTGSDGETAVAEVYGLIPQNFGNGYVDYIAITSMGNEPARINYNMDSTGVAKFGEDVSLTVDGVTSNTLEYSAFLKKQTVYGIVVYATAAEKSFNPDFKGFERSEAADPANILHTATIAVKSVVDYYHVGTVTEGEEYDVVTVPAETVIEAVYYVFGMVIDEEDLAPIANADGTVTLSMYHAENYMLPVDESHEFYWYAKVDSSKYQGDIDLGFETMTLTYTEDLSFYVKEISFTEKKPDYLPGDVTGDGRITMSDVLMMRKFIAGIIDLTDEQFMRADITGDGYITMSDVLRIRKIIAGID